MTEHKLHFLGAGNEVGRSAFLLDIGEQILLDYGVKLHADKTFYPLPIKTNLHAAILSHAHLDHSGHLPFLYRHHHPFMSFLTSPTLDVAKLLWQDTLKISKGEGGILHFEKPDIEKTEHYCFTLPYCKKTLITKKTSLELFDAGHILGSAISRLDFGNKSLVYTGDLNPTETRMFNGADLNFGETNYLMIESTYGDRNHPPRKKIEKEFVDQVNSTIENGGTCVIPAFAVGRTQEILEILDYYKVKHRIYLDGLGQKTTQICLNYPEYFSDSKILKKAVEKVTFVKGRKERKKILEQPSIVVTTAGMLQGGPVHYYLENIHDNPNSSVLLTGYQVEDTPGRKLLDSGIIDLQTQAVKVNCFVHKYDFSAHSSQHNLLKTIKKANPELVICVHGDEKVIKVFQEEISNEGFKSTAPKTGDIITL